MHRYELYDENGILVETIEREYTKEEEFKFWQAKIAATDEKMPRSVEGIIDSMTEEQKAKLPKFDLDNYNAKKEIRAQKPE